jgi:hypothetical protein|tara:strand:- start:477 stop:1001 length:525 start_codon:yes stop_codon:yes gene_type:complete
MAITSSYPIGTPQASDFLIGTSMPLPDEDIMPQTKNFSIQSVANFAQNGYVEATKILTKAEYQALQATDITLVGAQGAGKYIKVLSITATFVPEAAGNQMSFVTIDVGTTASAATTKVQAQIPVGVSGVTTKTVYSMATIGSIIDANLPLIVGTQTAVTGDGTLQFDLRYQVIQ